MLECTKCRQAKDESEFSANRGRGAKARGFKSHTCRACNHQYYLDNRDRHKLATRTNNIRSRYGLSLDAYEALIANGCSVCGDRDSRIVVDHCHKSNTVRGPLCNGCNIALGGAKDSPETLRALADYLELHGLVTAGQNTE